MKRALYNIVVRFYITYRGRIGYSQLREKTLHRLRRFVFVVEKSTQSQLDTRPPSGKWTATEIAYHAATTSNAILRTMNNARNGSDPQPPGKTAVGRTKVVNREELLQKCKAALAEAEEFDFSERGMSPSQRIPHPFLGPYDFKGWLTINVVHMERHFAQMKRALKI